MSGSSPDVGTGEGSPSMQAVRDLATAAGELRHAVAVRSGLSETELTALQHLALSDLGPADLSRLLHVSTAASTGIVDRLEQRGHAVRRPHPDDRRRVEVRLTASGRAEALGHLRPMLEALTALDAQFDAAEHAVVQRYLRGAIAAFEQVTRVEP